MSFMLMVGLVLVNVVIAVLLDEFSKAGESSESVRHQDGMLLSDTI